MKTQYKYIYFEETEKKTKTSIYGCLSKKNGGPLGVVKWYGPWRQYCFFPDSLTIFNKGCMEDINDFITQLMDERKK